MVSGTHQAHEYDVEEAELEAAGGAGEGRPPVLALQDVRVEPRVQVQVQVQVLTP